MKIKKFTLILSACLAGCMMAFTACGGSDKDKTSDADTDDKDYYDEEVTFENTQKEDPVKVDSAALRAITGPDRALESLHGNVRMVVTDNNSWKPDTAIFDTDGYYIYKTVNSKIPVDFSKYPKAGNAKLPDPIFDEAFIIIERDDNGYLTKIQRDIDYSFGEAFIKNIQWVDGRAKQIDDMGPGFRNIVEYSYYSNGDVISSVQDGGGEGGSWATTVKYRPTEIDEFGNWTERKVDVTITYYDEYEGDPEETETTTSIEKRQITYY